MPTLLPELQGQLDSIDAQTASVQLQIEAKEQELRAQAEENLRPPFWKRALNVLSSALSFVPIPVVSGIGAGLKAISSFVSSPSISSVQDLYEGITSPFKKASLDQSAVEFQQQIDQLEPPSTLSLDSIKTYASGLSSLGKQWGKVVGALKDATEGKQVPRTKLEAELNHLKAEDATFNALVDEINELVAQKEVFSQSLAQAIESIAGAEQQILAGYSSAAALKEQLDDTSATLRHETLEQVKKMDRAARDRLLRYQYNMAKAFEYEFLQPYTGNLQLENLFDSIANILSDPANDESWLENPANFESLKAVYENELRDVADQVWTNLNTTVPQRTTTISPRLNPDQIAQLNREGVLTINLVEEGFIKPERQNAKLLSIGVEEAVATTNGPFVQQADLEFRFEHSGISVVQSQGHQYVFQHLSQDSDESIFWASNFDADSGNITQAEVSPTQIANIAILLGLEASAVEEFFVHPSAWADITIRVNETVVPSTVDVSLEDVKLFVKYDSDLPLQQTVTLDVRTVVDVAPRIDIDVVDQSGKSDGRGKFTRFYDMGQAVRLEAEPTFGRYLFGSWQNDQGQIVSTNPVFSASLTDNTQLFVTYFAPGDFNLDGTIDSGDLFVWQGSYGLNGAADADDDGDSDGADFLAWQRNLSLPKASTNNADFDADNDVDGSDFLTWQRGFGNGAAQAVGDANGDGTVNAADLVTWENQFGSNSADFATISTSAATVSGTSLFVSNSHEGVIGNQGVSATMLDAAIVMEWADEEDDSNDIFVLQDDFFFEQVLTAPYLVARDLSLTGRESETESAGKDSSGNYETEQVWLADELLELVYG